MDWNNINRDRDTSGLGPIEYDQSKVPALIRKYADNVRTKTYGQEVREAQARNAEVAGLIASEAVGISNATNDRQSNLENTFNSLQQEITDVDVISAPEIIAARGDEPTLSDRLDKEHQNVTVQQEELNITKRNVELLGYEKYGEIVLPNDFNHDLTFKLWRDLDGKVKHNFDFNRHFMYYTTFYISENGDNSLDGKSEATAWKTLAHAIDTIEADSSVNGAKITVLDRLSRNRATLNKTITKSYLLDAKEEKYIGGFEGDLTWTLHSSGVYKAAENTPVAVYDARFKEAFGLPARYVKKSTLAECENTRGSWYTDGTSTYVHRLDDSLVTNDEVFVVIPASAFDINYGADSLFAMRNITMLAGFTTQYGYLHSDVASRGKLMLYDSKVIKRGFDTDGSGNGFYTDNLRSVWIFNTISKDAHSDAFNYHASLGGHCFVFEYDIVGMDCGILSASGNNNATTAHDGIHILRINSKGINANGPVLGDVNGCYSISIDCTMGESERGEGATKASYYFDDSPSPNNSNPNGKAILINCSGGSAETYGINCGESFKVNKITVDNFNGTNIPNDINFNFV